MCLPCGQNLSKRIHNRDKLMQQSIFVNGMSSGIPHGRHLLIIQKRCVERYNTEDGPRQQIKSRGRNIQEDKYCFDQLWSSRKLFHCTISLPYKTQLHFAFLQDCKTANYCDTITSFESCVKSLSLSHLSTN